MIDNLTMVGTRDTHYYKIIRLAKQDESFSFLCPPLLTCLAYMHFTVSGVRSICSNPDLFFSVALPEALFILKAKIF